MGGPGGNAGERLKGRCAECGSPLRPPEKPGPAAWPKVVAYTLLAAAILLCIWLFLFFGGTHLQTRQRPISPIPAGSHVRAVENPAAPASGKMQKLPPATTAVPPGKSSLHASHVHPKSSPSKAERVVRPEAAARGPAVSIGGGAAGRPSVKKPAEAEKIAPAQRVPGKTFAAPRKKTGDLLDIPLPN